MAKRKTGDARVVQVRGKAKGYGSGKRKSRVLSRKTKTVGR